jgi:sugar fermentation stimulation protein A
VKEGCYIAVFHLPADRDITIGRLGKFMFRKGFYFYVGCGGKNISARIDRHERRRKSLRWHIDYLSVKAPMLGAILISGDKDKECRLADQLAELLPRPVAGFGSSDCRCPGHLFFSPHLPDPHA